MKKKLLFLTISLLSSPQVFSAQPAETLSTGELLRSEHQATYNNPDLPLEGQIRLTKEGVDGLTVSIAKLKEEKKELYLTELRKAYGFSDEDTPKKVASLLSRILQSEKERLGTLEDQLAQTGPKQKTLKGKDLSVVDKRRARAKELRSDGAAAAEARTPQREEGYQFAIADDTSITDRSPVGLARAGIFDCEHKLRNLGDDIGVVSDRGWCPCCGFIAEEETLIHYYNTQPEKKISKPLRLDRNGFSLHKKPTEWLSALQSDPTSTIEDRNRAEKIVNTFLAIQGGTRNTRLLAEAICAVYQHAWKCIRQPGQIESDGTFPLPPA